MAACDLCAFAAPRLGRAGRMAPCDLCACAAPRLARRAAMAPCDLCASPHGSLAGRAEWPLAISTLALRRAAAWQGGRQWPLAISALAPRHGNLARRAQRPLAISALARLGRAGGNGCLDCVFRSFRPHQADVRSCLFKIRQRPSFPLRALPRHISGGSGRILSCHNPVKKTDLPAFLPWLLPPGFVVRARLHLGP